MLLSKSVNKDSDGTVTQRDIAARAGVTQMTVSLALRGAAGVSEQTVERIQQLAEEMGYAPNPLVSSLMRTRRGRGKVETGLAIAWHGSVSSLRKKDRGRPDLCDTYAEMLAGARASCQRNGFGLEVFPHMETDRELPRILKARGIRGLVLGPIGPNAERGLPIEQLEGVHLVRLERDLREARFDRVVSNAFEEMTVCVKALAKSGCRRIGYIDQQGHQKASEDRWKGAFLGTSIQGVEILRPCLSEVGRTDAGGALRSYLKEKKPDGLVVGSRMFIGSMVNRHKAGRGLPFACLERNAWPDWVSGVETNFQQIGAEAARLLINRILSPHIQDWSRRTIAMHSMWHEGRSHLPGGFGKKLPQPPRTRLR